MTIREHRLDRTDFKILNVLQEDARIQNKKLAERVNLSPSACLARVKRLHDRGYVKSNMAQLELSKVCSHVSVFCTITLTEYSPENYENFENRVQGVPELVECYKVSGQFDYLLHFVCTDMGSYHQISKNLLGADVGVSGLNSHVVLDQTKTFSGFPLGELTKKSRR